MIKNKHRKILDAIYDRPIRANIHWHDIEAMMAALGAEIINKGGSVVTFSLRGYEATFHRPHPQKETHKASVKRVGEWLEELGVRDEYDEL